MEKYPLDKIPPLLKGLEKAVIDVKASIQSKAHIEIMPLGQKPPWEKSILEKILIEKTVLGVKAPRKNPLTKSFIGKAVLRTKARTQT